MKKLLYIYGVIILTLISGCSRNYPDKLYEKKPAYYSYIVGNVKSENVDEEYASEVYVTPASCQKVVTSLIALKALGPHYHYVTKLFVVPSKKNKKAINDIVIKFSGDPTLRDEDLLYLLKPLKNTKINGRIILDATTFQTPYYSPNIMIDDIGTDYASPVSSININKNFITLVFSPTKIGKDAVFRVNADYKVNSNVKTTIEKTSIKLSWDGEVINAVGNINIDESLLFLPISPKTIDLYSIKKVQTILNILGIKGKIEIINDKNNIPSNLKLINEIKSKPLKDIIKPALKISDNSVFDSLYLTVINFYNKNDVKKWNEGDAIVKALAKEYYSIDFSDGLFVDGSGLSRYNRIQPKKLFLLLKKGITMPEFVEALARPGEDKSTLKKRTVLPSTVFAKTGNISGVSCLCGYRMDPKPKAFVIMINSFAPPKEDVFVIMDNFVKKMK